MNHPNYRYICHYTLHHEHSADCLCHRIVRAGGALGGYIPGSITEKTKRLAEEGILFQDDAINLERYGFRDFQSARRPLEELRDIQTSLQRRVRLCARRRIPRLVGGVDVAYPEPDIGVAAYALVEALSGKLVWTTAVRRPVRFPYISTYLAFREIPILLELLDAVRSAGRIAEVLLVDGSGILHHRHAGIASHLGVAASMPTIGVSKKLLCGQVDIEGMEPGESRPVLCNGQRIGTAIRPTAGSRRPIFVSPGHRVDPAFSERLVRLLLIGRRLPEPLYWADRESRSRGRRRSGSRT